MTAFFEFLNTNSGVLSLLFSLIVAVSTVFYVIYTKRLTDETRSMRRAQTEPYVLVSPYFDEYSFTVAIRVVNVGQGPAKNVVARLQSNMGSDVICRGGNKLNEMGIFANGMKYMPPGYELNYTYGSANNVFDFKSEITKKFTANIVYYDKIGSRHAEVFVLDFEELQNIWYKRSPEADGVKSLKDINSELIKIRSILEDHKTSHFS